MRSQADIEEGLRKLNLQADNEMATMRSFTLDDRMFAIAANSYLRYRFTIEALEWVLYSDLAPNSLNLTMRILAEGTA